MARVLVVLDDELWLWRSLDSTGAAWHLAPPWIHANGKPASGMIAARPGEFRVLPAGTEVDLDVWHRGCAGCDAIREMQRHIGGIGETVTVEHNHGAP